MTVSLATICLRADRYHIRIFANCSCLAFSAANQGKSSYFVLVKMSTLAGTLFYQSWGVCNNLTGNEKAKFSRNNNFVIE